MGGARLISQGLLLIARKSGNAKERLGLAKDLGSDEEGEIGSRGGARGRGGGWKLASISHKSRSGGGWGGGRARPRLT